MVAKDFAHPRCYARALRGCSRKLSREHYVSKAVLDLLGDEHRITNASWLRPAEESGPIPSSALRSKILCEHHNNTLSPLDAHAKRFFSELLWGLSDRPPLEAHRRVALDGDQLELWVLKACCGAFASGNLIEHRRTVPRQVPDAWVNLLFRGGRWESGAGLHIRQTTLTPHLGYALGPVYVGDSCAGGGIEFAGMEMFVFPSSDAEKRILEESSAEMNALIHRPGAIRIESRSRTLEIALQWRAWISIQGVQYRWSQ